MVQTRIFCRGDTHGKVSWPRRLERFDVVVHCGDLTNTSTLNEFRRVVRSLEELDAPLKLVIPGNHDKTLDPEAYAYLVADSDTWPSSRHERFESSYGLWGEAEQLFLDAGITLLSQGTHRFTLENGAALSVYANPGTPSDYHTGGFQYHPDDGDLQFSDLREHVDIVLTHGPPHGMLDRDYESRLCGCPGLLSAVTRAKPLLHVFGHIHEGWGAVHATWERRRDKLDYWKTWRLERWVDYEDEHDDGDEKASSLDSTRDKVLRRGRNTLFLNAAVSGHKFDSESRPPWVVDLDLPLATVADESAA